MKPAVKVTARRIAHDGQRVLQLVCPVCDRRHWVSADSTTAWCSRRHATYEIDVKESK